LINGRSLLAPVSDVEIEHHGGNRTALAAALGIREGRLLDASASLAPLTPAVRCAVMWHALQLSGLRDYPDRGHTALRSAIAALHGLPPDWVLPGNGAAELFTWAARDAAAAGVSALPSPGFADYGRALACWGGSAVAWMLPVQGCQVAPRSLPPPPRADVIWITNPHNPTGQLWSRDSLLTLLRTHRLVICDEAFLPLVRAGEAESLIPWLAHHPNLIVIRSLTKLYGLAGLRLGYALAAPQRLGRWASWRDPWPLNGLALALGLALLGSPARYHRHCAWVQRWSADEGTWLRQQLTDMGGPAGTLQPLPSAANFFLLHGQRSLMPLHQALVQRHAIVLRDCRSFAGLGECWLRIGVQSRRANRRLARAMAQEWRLMPP